MIKRTGMARREFIKSMSVGAIATSLSTMSAQPEKRPNLLFLMTDDQRADAGGYSGNHVIKTPALDALAQKGTVFTKSFVTTSICCVSRATVFTGQYARRHTINDFAKTFTVEQFAGCYPQILRRHGYYVGFIGKWGIGANDLTNLEQASLEFDYWAGASHQTNFWHEVDCAYVTDNKTCTCPSDRMGVAGPDIRSGYENLRKPVHQSIDIIPAKVEQFLDQCPVDQPFCLSISLKWPHAPFSDWHPRFENVYTLSDIPIPVTATPEEADKQPEFLKQSLSSPSGMEMTKDHSRLRKMILDYYRLVSTGDYGLTRIFEALNRSGVDDNTIIIFTSDNGHFFGEHGFLGKWLMHEESIHVPTIIYDPRIPEQERIPRQDATILNTDFAPTILAIAGIKVPDTMQGSDLTPLLTNMPPKKWRRDWFYEHVYEHGGSIEPCEGVRSSRWKYIRYYRQEPVYESLFDLDEDPLETRDFAREREYQGILKEHRARWYHYRASLV